MKNSPLALIIHHAMTVMSMEASCSGGSQPSLPRLDSQKGILGVPSHGSALHIRLSRQAGVNWEQAALLSQQQTETVSFQIADDCWCLNS